MIEPSKFYYENASIKDLSVYFDWNVFNKFGSLESLPDEDHRTYKILDLCIHKLYFVPYSTAHLQDLFTGYKKNQSFVQAHLKNIERISQNRSIFQYQDFDDVKFEINDVQKKFQELIGQSEDLDAKPLEELLNFEDLIDDSDEMRELKRESREAAQAFISFLRESKIPEEQFDGIEGNDKLKRIFKQSLSDRNILGMINDILLNNKLLEDPKTYKEIRKQTIKPIHPSATLLDTLQLSESLESHSPHFKKASKNQRLNRIVELYLRINNKGYESDSNFRSMIQDALHVFYASHFPKFITLDKKCASKARLVFEELKIDTIVLSPEQYADQLETILIQLTKK